MKRKLYPSLLFAVSLFAIFGLEMEVPAQAKEVIPDPKIEKMLKEIGSPYTVVPGVNSFIIPYSGKEKKEIAVLVVPVGSAVMIGADVAAGLEVDLTPNVMRKLLEYNLNADYIKVGIGEKGTITVQTEQTALINSETFKVLLDQVAAGADEVAKILKPVRKNPTTKGN